MGNFAHDASFLSIPAAASVGIGSSSLEPPKTPRPISHPRVPCARPTVSFCGRINSPSRRSELLGERLERDATPSPNCILAALERKHLELARDEGVAAFMIFPDRTLIDMTEKRPATLDEMLQVQGVGERKLARYGDAFLEALEEALL